MTACKDLKSYKTKQKPLVNIGFTGKCHFIPRNRQKVGVSHETSRDDTMISMAEPTERQKIGKLGEDIAARHLKNKGFSVIEQNYRKKCGEIDIIAKKGSITHFIEVKTVTHENTKDFGANVSRVTDKYRPEDNIHPRKLKRLARVIQLYLYEKHSNGSPEWVFDVITVHLDTKNKQARVIFLENIIM